MKNFKSIEEARAELGNVDLVPIADSDFGQLSRQMESGGDPSAISGGKGDAGGRSYGSYQIASQNGTMQDFLDYAKGTSPSIHSRLGAAALTGKFDSEWKGLAKEDPQGFHDLQHGFVQDRHYTPLARAAEQMGIDTASRSSALNNYLFATAVHMGPTLASKALAEALSGSDPRSLSDAQIIDKLAVQKSALDDKGGLAYWRRSSPKVQQSVLDRLEQERDIALQMLDAEGQKPEQDYASMSFGRPNENNLQPQPAVAPSQGRASLAPSTEQELAQSFNRNPAVSGQDTYERASQQGAMAGPSSAPQQEMARSIRQGQDVTDDPNPFGGPGTVSAPPAVQAPSRPADVRMAKMLGVDAGDQADALGGTPVSGGPLSRYAPSSPESVGPTSPADAALVPAKEPGFMDRLREMVTGKMSKDEATSVLVLQDELQKRSGQNVPTETVLLHKKEFLKQLGWKPQGSTAELLGVPMTMGVVAALGTNPMTTLAALGAFEAYGAGKGAAVKSIDPDASHLVDLAIGGGVSSNVRDTLRGMETVAELLVGGRALKGLHDNFTKPSSSRYAEKSVQDAGMYYDEMSKGDPARAGMSPEDIRAQREAFIQANPDGVEVMTPNWSQREDLSPREAWVVIKDKAAQIDELLGTSQFWRELSIPERALVVQDAASSISAMRKQGVPDQEIIRVIGRTFGKDDPAFQKLWDQVVVESGRAPGASPSAPVPQDSAAPAPEARESVPSVVGDPAKGSDSPVGLADPSSGAIAVGSSIPTLPPAVMEPAPAASPSQEEKAAEHPGMSHEEAMSQILAEGESAINRAHDENPTPEEGLSGRVIDTVRRKAEDRALSKLLEYQSISQTTHDVLQAKLDEMRNPEPSVSETPKSETQPAQAPTGETQTASPDSPGDMAGLVELLRERPEAVREVRERIEDLKARAKSVQDFIDAGVPPVGERANTLAELQNQIDQLQNAIEESRRAPESAPERATATETPKEQAKPPTKNPKSPPSEDGFTKDGVRHVYTSDRNAYKAAVYEHERYIARQSFEKIDSQRLDAFKAKAPGQRQAESWKIMPVQTEPIAGSPRSAVTDGHTMIFDNPWPKLRSSMADFVNDMAKPMPVHKWIQAATLSLGAPSFVGTLDAKIGPVAYFAGVNGSDYAIAIPVSGLQALKSAGATGIKVPEFKFIKATEGDFILEFKEIENPGPLIAYKGMTPIGAVSPMSTVASVKSLQELADGKGKGVVVEKPTYISRNLGGGKNLGDVEQPVAPKVDPEFLDEPVSMFDIANEAQGDVVPPGDATRPSPFVGNSEMGQQVGHHREVPLHWIVEQIVDFTGKMPQIKGLPGGLRGFMTPKTLGITVNKNLGKDKAQLMRTFAHEFGHLIVFLPHKAFSKGVLANMAGIKKYSERFIAGAPWLPGPLTAAEIAAMKADIERAQSTTGERWVDEVITKTMPGVVSPDDVLAIWRGTTENLPQALVRYVAGLGRAEKKAVMVSCMKGLMPQELAALAGTVTQQVKTGRKIKQTFSVTPDPQAVMDELTRRVEEELARRQLIDEKFIKGELKELSLVWRPWDRKSASPGFAKYRDSTNELIADALSALLNNPEWAQQMSPTFFKGFFNYIGNRPAFYKAYQELQDKLQYGDMIGELDAKLRATFKSGDVAQLSLIDKMAKAWSSESIALAKMYFWNRWNPVQASVNKRGGDRALKAEMNPMTAIDDFLYVGSIQHSLNHYLGEVVNKAAEMGVSFDDLGAYVAMKAVLGSRGEVISPVGDAEAEKLIARYEQKNPKIKEIYKEWQSVWRDKFLQRMVDIEYWPDKFIDRAANNPDYARYQYEMYLESKSGSPGMSGGAIKALVGSFTLPMNPIPQMIDFATVSLAAAYGAQAKKAVFDDLVAQGKARLAQVNVIGKGQVEFVRPDLGSGMSLLQNYWNGRRVGYIVPTPVAMMFDADPRGNWVFSTISHVQSLFKKAFVHWNPNFIMKNPARDIAATFEHIPLPKNKEFAPLFLERQFAISLAMAAGDIARSAGIGAAKKTLPFLKVLDKLYPGLIKEYENRLAMADSAPNVFDWLMENGGLISPGHYADWFGDATGEATKLEDLMVRHGVNNPDKKWYMKNPATRGIYHLHKGLEAATQSTEYLTKVAGAIFLKRMRDSGRMPGLTDRQIIHSVRNDVGSPNYLRQPTGRLMINLVTMFTGPARTGLMQDYAAWKRDGSSYITRKIKYAAIPGMVKAALKYGTIGAATAKVVDSLHFIFPHYANDDEGKKKARAAYDSQAIGLNQDGISMNYVMRGVGMSDYLTNHIVPLGYTPTGMSVYLKIPMTEYPSRLMSNAAFFATSYAMSKDLTVGESVRALAGKTIGDLPGITPPAGVLNALSKYYVNNQSPVNGFTHKPYVPDAYMKDGDPRAGAMFWSGLLREYGGVADMFVGPLIRFKNDNPFAIKDEVQDNLRESFVGKLARPFVAVSDQGFREDMERIAGRVGADRRNSMREGMAAFDKMLRRENVTPVEMDKAALFANTPDARVHVKKLMEEAASGPLRGALASGNKVEDAVVLMNAMKNPLLQGWAMKYIGIKSAEGK